MQVSKELDKKCGQSQKQKKINQTFKRALFPIVFDIFSSSIGLILTMNQTICASFKRTGSKMWTLSHKPEKNEPKFLKVPFPIMLDGFSSFSIGLILTMI